MSLLHRVKTRRPEAWRRLVDLYSPLIYGWCRRWELDAEDAADVIQNVFSSVVSAIGDFRGARRRGAFRAWLRSITQHTIQDLLRDRVGQPVAKGGTDAHQRMLEVPQPPDPPTGDDSADEEHALWRRAVELVRAEFEERTWRAFWRVVVDMQRPRDVAEELGMTLAAVYKAKSRVLHRARQELAELEAEA